jgi:hypothetical protein
MRIRAVAAVVGASAAMAVPVLAASEASTAVAAPRAGVACIHARIGGHRVCLGAGRTCAHRYEHQYLRHGFTCVRANRHSRYRLQFAQQQSARR